MDKNKKIFGVLHKSYLQIICAVVLIVLAGGLLWFSNTNSMQADSALIASVYFEGEYRIGDGEWCPIVEGEHIPSTKGDVTLRGNFHMLAPDGEYVGIYRGEIPIAFHVDHISLTFKEGDGEPYLSDAENPIFGDAACGDVWIANCFMSDENDIIEILVHNPHSFGNDTAIDEMIAGISLWSGIEFEKEILTSGETQRNIGLLFVIVSLMLLGIALFASLIHVKNNVIFWQTGLVAMFAGIYFAYSADGVFLWSESIVSNTALLGLSMMFYMFFLSTGIVLFLKETKRVGNFAVILMAIVNAVIIIIPIVSNILFYDTFIFWAAAQAVVNLVLIVCLVKEFIAGKGDERWLHAAAILPLLTFFLDIILIWLGIFDDAEASKYTFIILFAVAVILVLKLVPHNINAAAKAKELEIEKIMLNAELAESRISTMMSQIRPHFIYNTLGSIEQLCKLDPPKAGELVHNFAKYLRGNFGELDNPKPILMSQEMEHVHHYISIENVRFPDMSFRFEMNSDDFKIPALTIQPIVENAIKHGLMKLQKGGTIHVVSYETDSEYCILVEDDGVGFDTNALLDDRKHVGLRNIRERLKVMVKGTLEIESTVGVGTKVLVRIPKEERV